MDTSSPPDDDGGSSSTPFPNTNGTSNDNDHESSPWEADLPPGHTRSRVEAELDALRKKRLSKTNKSKFKGSGTFLTPEEKAQLLAQSKQSSRNPLPPPPTTSSSSHTSEFDSWYLQQRNRLLQEKKRRTDAEKLLRGYRGSSSLPSGLSTRKIERGSLSSRQVKYVPAGGMVYKGETWDVERVKKLCEGKVSDELVKKFEDVGVLVGDDGEVLEDEEFVKRAVEGMVAMEGGGEEGMVLVEDEGMAAEEIVAEMMAEGMMESVINEVAEAASSDREEEVEEEEEEEESVPPPDENEMDHDETTENSNNDDKIPADEDDNSTTHPTNDESIESSPLTTTPEDNNLLLSDSDLDQLPSSSPPPSSPTATTLAPPSLPHPTKEALSAAVYQIDFSVRGLGKRLPSNKRRIRWRFGIPSTSTIHDVILYWSLTSGKRTLIYNNQIIHSSQKQNSPKFSQTFTSDDDDDDDAAKEIHVVAYSGMASRQYDLFYDDVSFFKLPKWDNGGGDDETLWKGLGLDRMTVPRETWDENDEFDEEDGAEVEHEEGMEIVHCVTEAEGESDEFEAVLQQPIMAKLSIESAGSFGKAEEIGGDDEEKKHEGDVLDSSSPAVEEEEEIEHGVEDAEEVKRGDESSSPPLAEAPSSPVASTGPKHRHVISDEPDALFPPEPQRYHLYISNACPNSHAVNLTLALRQLSPLISISVVDPIWRDIDDDGRRGWVVMNNNDKDDDNNNDAENIETIRELYQMSNDDEGVDGSYPLPLLWDKQQKMIVNNDTIAICQMLCTAFHPTTINDDDDDDDDDITPPLDLYPSPLRKDINTLSSSIDHSLRHQAYRAGFATTQQDYQTAMTSLVAEFDKVEDRIATTTKFLMGECLTLADVRLFAILLRYDEVYNGLFRVNARCVRESKVLLNFCREVYKMDGVKETCDMDSIKAHYYCSYPELNKYPIVPVGVGFMDLLEIQQPSNDDES